MGAWAVSTTLRRVPLLGAAVRSWAFLRRRTEVLLLKSGELLAEKLELHLRVDVTTAQAGVLSLQPGDFPGLSDGGLLEVGRDLLEGADVGDLLQPRHGSYYQ